MIAGPIALLLLPLLVAGVVLLLSRWRTPTAVLSTATALALGVAALALPVDRPVKVWGGLQIVLGAPVSFLGRELVLEETDRLACAALFFTSAIIFFLAWRSYSRSLLFPVGWGLLSLSVGVLLVKPFVYAALFIEIAVALSVFALQSEEGPVTRGGMRYLTFSTMALPGILVTHWLLERYEATPDETWLLSTSAVLLAISFALLLGVFPFHSWIPALFGDSSPVAGAFVLTVFGNVIWFALLEFLEAYSWLSAHPSLSSLTLNAGLVLVLLGGTLAPAQRRLSPLVGYGTLVENGAMLIALGLRSEVGMVSLLLAMLTRPLGLGLMALGLDGIRAHSGGKDDGEGLRGVGWRAPWSTTAFVLGGLSVAGLPLGAGFAWRWSLYRALADTDPGTMVLLLLAAAGVMGGLWRGMASLLERPRLPEARSVFPPATREGKLFALSVLIALLLCVVVSIYPQLLSPWVTRMVDACALFR
ncbi:MAG: proton-conducting transporter membrane subunit [Anaerolineae bacterium]|nr:proton-conducting transporter membrane subunit [Anaerolineae bacterium]